MGCGDPKLAMRYCIQATQLRDLNAAVKSYDLANTDIAGAEKRQ